MASRRRPIPDWPPVIALIWIATPIVLGLWALGRATKKDFTSANEVRDVRPV